MSMIGEYLRVTPADLDKAIQDPDWAVLLAEAAQDAARTHPHLRPADARHYSTYRTWDLLRHLLTRVVFPVNVMQGEELFPDPEDWVYGPPRYLPPDRVHQAAERLTALPKYVVSTTISTSEWNNARFVKNGIVETVTRLKQEPGGDILVAGSSTLIQTLMQHDLVDEYRFLLYPLVVGNGQRLFTAGIPATLELVEAKAFGTGVVALTYRPRRDA